MIKTFAKTIHVNSTETRPFDFLISELIFRTGLVIIGVKVERGAEKVWGGFSPLYFFNSPPIILVHHNFSLL